MLKIQNCKKCGKVFQTNGFLEICINCREQDEKQFHKIREYLRAHPGSNIWEIAQNTEVPVAEIKRYLREERLEIIQGENGFINCDSCGKPIQTGRYCDSCASKLAHDFKVVFNTNHKDRKVKFHSNPKDTKKYNK